jgi:hypothetical protein
MRVRLWLVAVSLACVVVFELLDVPIVSRHTGVAAVEPVRSMPASDAVAAEAPVVADVPRARDTARVRVTVRVYSSSDLDADAQRAALDVAQATFAAAAIQIVWKICGQVACDTPLLPPELLVRIVESGSGCRQGDRCLGEALIDPKKRTGVLATVYVNRTLRLARNVQIDHSMLLGRTLAHEIAHLLLATNVHATSGLMREVWSRNELLRTRRDDWILQPRDAAAILDRLAS